ncbi:vesicle-associated membrane protein 8 isoform X2 [Epinephelus fuscoguttatus]|uniref:vesicle-associated membrane protein 8 isoform X2 n=1 Tax=Epinephelus fuscoguttatus TaxID=293821 RepID=UPI0020D00780|nr:vesicle-associated membrane protein 8 isoform X2 [Epinephelus fuscoguttatus]
MDNDPERGGVAEPASQSKVQTLRGEVDELSDKMKENMKGIIKKGEKVVDLLTRSENMKKEAEDFKYRSKEVESKYWWKNVKLITVIVVVVLIVILIIILLATGVIPVSAPMPPVVTPSSKP